MNSAEISIYYLGDIPGEFHLELNKTVHSYHPDYIWNIDSLTFTQKDKMIKGKLTFGDCIEDEWFAVYILFKLSTNFPIAIKVTDEDGEFLLIEVAEELTDIDPLNSEFRTFIYQGSLHIIPLEISVTSMDHALSIIQSNIDTRASAAIQKILNDKINQFPEKIASNFHYSKVLLPETCAYLFCNDPTLIAPVVDSIYTRDPISEKKAGNVNVFDSPLVPITLKFTKTLYAQLHSIDLPLPLDKKEEELGRKLLLGLKIFYNNAINEQVDMNGWEYFLERLKTLDFFKGEIEGSELYNRNYELARKIFLTEKGSNSNRLRIAAKMLKFLNSPTKLQIYNGPSDSDDFLFMDTEELDKIMASRTVNLDLNDLDSLNSEEIDHIDDIHNMATGVSDFIAKESGVKGARFPGEYSESEDSDDEYLPIKFDSEVFISKMSEGLHCKSTPTDFESNEDTGSISNLMKIMDNELSQALPNDFDNLDEAEMKIHLVKNMLKSIESQQGLAGPGSNIIGSLGLNMPTFE